MAQRTVTESILEWKNGTLSTEEVTRAVCIEAWQRLGRLEEDERGEFVLYFHRRIRGMIERYDPERGPFEAYLATSLKYQLRSFRARKARSRYRRAMPMDPEFWKSSCSRPRMVSLPALLPEERDGSRSAELLMEAEAAYQRTDHRKHPEAFRRRLLFVALKCSPYASQETVAEMAQVLKIDAPWMEELSARLRERYSQRDQRRRKLMERQNEIACSLYVLRRELAAGVQQWRRQRVIQMIGELTKRARRLSREIDRIPQSVSNLEIARVLDIPKGSVDSGIFYVRETLRKQRWGCEEPRAREEQREQEG